MTYEKSADELDMAGHIQDQLNTAGLAQVRAAGAPQVKEGEVCTHCVDCEDALPPVRIAYKRIRCTPCQCKVEAAAKRGR